MRLVSLSPDSSVLLYESIFQLSAGRYADFQHYAVREAGIGSTAGAIDRHFAQLGALVAAAAADPARLAAAADELALLHYAFASTLDKFNCRHLAFGCLVAEFDGQPCTDFSEAGLTRLLAALGAAGLTEALVAAEVDAVKKKWRAS